MSKPTTELQSVHHRRARLRMIMRLLVTAAAVAAVALGVIGVAFESAPSAAPVARATTLRTVLPASTPGPSKIVHVSFSATETRAGGAVYSWSDDAWIGYPNGPGRGFGLGGPAGFRQILRHSGLTVQTGAAFGRRLLLYPNIYFFPGAELYDTSTHTIYELQPVLQPPPFDSPKAPPITSCQDAVTGGAIAGVPTAFSGSTKAMDRMTKAGALATRVYLGGPSARPFFSGFNTVVPDVWSPCTAEDVAKFVRGGFAKRIGGSSLDGRRVIEYAATDGSWTYYADARSNDPVRLVVRGIDGLEFPQRPVPKRERATLTVSVSTYDQLPFRGNERLLSLTAAHPGARVDTRAADYYAVQARLFPRRRWG